MNAPTSLDTLSAAWLAAKADEDAARARRYEIEAQIVAMLPGADEGTTTNKLDTVKVSVTRKLTRSVDTAALQEHWSFLPAQAQAVFKWSADIDTRKLRAAQDMAPDAYAAAAQFITAKPSKPGVKVEVL